MGESGYFSNLVMELSLVHDVENIHVVDLTQLMAKDDLPPEVSGTLKVIRGLKHGQDMLCFSVQLRKDLLFLNLVF